MGGIKASWKKANRAIHDPPGGRVAKQTTDQEKGLSKKKKKKNAAKKLKDFWEKKKQQQKNLSPNADDVSIKDAAMQLPTTTTKTQHMGNPNEVLSPRTAPETVDSALQQLPVLPNDIHAELKTSEQIFRRQKEAPGKKGMEIMEVIIPANNAAQLGNISPISIDYSAFYAQPRQQQPGVPSVGGVGAGSFDPPTTHFTEGMDGVELELAQALQLPSLQQQRNHHRRGGGRGTTTTILDDLASETTSSTRGRTRERAQNVSAPGRRRVRPNSGNNNRITRHEPPIFSTAIDLTDVENEEQAMKLALGMDAFDDISNPLTAVPDVFGSLTDLLKDPPVDGEEEDERSEGIASFKAGSNKGGGVDDRDDRTMRTMRTTVDVMNKETTKGAPFDPIDLTDSDYRLFVRKPVEAINVGLIENADDAYDEMIDNSHSIVTKATHRMLGRNNAWYLG
mmetsp:Transcript_27318/g.66299  ORF Transcript_27318/g.66299 Transcript_27318/m.66299 type:complete len:451 (-) Transcript_27318:323-1675(-)